MKDESSRVNLLAAGYFQRITGGSSRVFFPLPPAERENCRQSVGESGAVGIFAREHRCSLPVKRNVGQASRLPPSAEPTQRPRSRGRVSWAGETPALRWRRRDSRAHGAQKVRRVLSLRERAKVRGKATDQ